MYDNIQGVAAVWLADQSDIVKMGRSGKEWTVELLDPWTPIEIIQEGSEYSSKMSNTTKEGVVFTTQVKISLAFADEDGFWKQFRKPKIVLVQDQNDTLYMIGNISAGSRAKDGNIKCSPSNSRDVTLECATPYAPFVMAWDTVISNHSSIGDFSDDFMNQDYD